jgi:AcrR family transcriptional regulator
MLERDGPVALTARDVASAAGTSTAAMYELFGNKAGLVRALFYEGFRALHERLVAVPVTADARADLVTLLAVYRSFGVEHPVLFELMYARPFAEFSPTADDLGVAAGIYRLVVRAVRRCLTASGATTDPTDAAHTLVALTRGLVAAEIAGVLGSSGASRHRRWRLAVEAQLDGLNRTR